MNCLFFLQQSIGSQTVNTRTTVSILGDFSSTQEVLASIFCKIKLNKLTIVEKISTNNRVFDFKTLFGNDMKYNLTVFWIPDWKTTGIC